MLTTAESAPPRAGVRQWLGLAVVSMAVLLIAVDGTVLDLAVPSLSDHLGPSGTELLWIIDVYSFVLAALLVTMGVLADRVGRRRLLMIGAAGFGLASLMAALSTTPVMLIAARVLMGVFGATLMPSTLGLIRALFPDTRQRATAIGIWGAMWGGGAAIGPLIGGVLLEHFWWGSVFLINIPVLIVLLIALPLTVPESKDPAPGRFDVPGMVLFIAAMVPLVFALKETAVAGVQLRLLAIAAIGVAAAVGFIRRQRRTDHPLMDLSLFSNPVFTASIVTNLLSVFALAGVLFFGSQYLQMVLGLSPLTAGLWATPGTAASVLGALLAAAAAARWGDRTVLAVSMAATAAGALLLVGLDTDGHAWLFATGFTIIGLGSGVGLTLTSALILAAVRPEKAGAASGMSETSYELGLAAGVAVLGSVLLAIYRAGIDVTGLAAEQASAAKATLGGAMHVARDRADEVGAAMFDSAQHSFVAGMHVAAAVTAAVMAGVAVLVWVLLSARRTAAFPPGGQDAESGGADPAPAVTG